MPANKLPLRVPGGQQHAAVAVHKALEVLIAGGQAGSNDILWALVDNAAFLIALVAKPGAVPSIVENVVAELNQRAAAHCSNTVVTSTRERMFGESAAKY